MLVGPGEVTADVLSSAATLVVFGGIFDMMDGRVARLTAKIAERRRPGREHRVGASEFGMHLDNLADVIGFGVAPAVLAYAWSLHELGVAGIAVAFAFTVCAAFRLARFGVDSTGGEWSLEGHSRGLTSTMAGGTLVTLVWVFNDYLAHLGGPPAYMVAGLTMLLAVLMVSSVPFRNFKNLRSSTAARSLLAVFFATCLVGAVVLHPSMWFGTGAVLYLCAGLLDGLVVYRMAKSSM